MAILLPVLVQVGLTFFLQGWMGYERYKAVRDRSVQWGANKGVRPIWPERAGIVSNAFHNQLEMPMLFYAVVALALSLNAVDDTLVALAWAYAVLRLIHAAIHTTYNKIPHRFSVYLLSSAVLMVMWGKLGSSVLGGA